MESIGGGGDDGNSGDGGGGGAVWMICSTMAFTFSLSMFNTIHTWEMNTVGDRK